MSRTRVLGGGVVFLLAACPPLFAQDMSQADPPAAEAGQPHYLELVLNRQPTGRVVRVLRRGDRFRVAAGDLRALELPVFGGDAELVVLDELPWMTTRYDENNLRLWLDVRPDLLPMQYVDRYRRTPHAVAQASNGATLNYDLFSNHPAHGPASTSIGNTLRWFGAWGAVTSTGVHAHAPRHRYIRYDTRWQYSDPDRMRTWEAGDLVTRGLAWNSAVRIAGAALSRDFSVRPDVVTFPLPVFSGQVAVPSTLDVFIDGQKIDRQPLAPGPFTLTNLPYINGAGEAVVVTTDALGRQVSTTLPFYVSSALLAGGMTDYSIAAGSLRRDYGLSNFSYGSTVATGSLRRGVSDAVTLEGHAELASALTLAGVGAVVALGHHGVLDASVAHSRMRRRRGGQATLGYHYVARRYSLALQQLWRDAGYADLSVLPAGTPALTRRRLQATGAMSLARLGNLGVGYFDIRSAEHVRNRQLNLSWSRNIGDGSHLFFSATRDIIAGTWAYGLQWLWSFGGRDTVHAGFERGGNGDQRLRLDYGRAIPASGGVGWQLGAAREPGGAGYGQASVHWRNPHMHVRVGAYGTDEASTGWGNLTGSLAMLDGHVFATNRIDDAFVLVDTDGQAGVPVRYENQWVGNTDRDGHLLVPWVTAWHAAKYQIDPLRLPPHVSTPVVEQRVAVRGGSGHVVHFEVAAKTPAVVTIHDPAGVPVPAGTMATTTDGQQHTIGWDGVLYLEHAAEENEIVVDVPSGPCRVHFKIDARTPHVARIGPLACHPESAP